MIKIIRNVKVYTPKNIGKKDVLILGDKIASIEDKIDINISSMEVEEIKGEGKILTPGFIDCHVHILGGGGEGGFKTRTPEINLTTLTTAGVTTVVGTLGTDGVCRDIESLLAKARGLEEEGITSYIYTGSYQVPTPTLTGDIMKDIMSIDKIIGAGEIALSDHRSSQPTFEEFIRLAANVRVAGMLSGKAGIINIHMGDGKKNLDYLNRAVDETELPITQFLPTHCGRNKELFEESIKYMKRGGYCDFTGADDPDLWEREYGEVRISKAIKRIIEEKISIDNFTFTSDGQGSFPMFNEKNEYIGLGMGKSSCLLEAIKECVFKEDIPLEIALRGITSNPARILSLTNKGNIKKGFDADINLLDEETLDIDTVIAKGRIMLRDKLPIVFGTFEENK
ncbi:beta-aspartyl-peptidase [Peptoniphilus porci]|uniref:Isoaspartyl dipeptidase n=1 Tax=Peptoniphilus porci TaxID=2652280 RepID=A0A1U7M1W1_9FIRM|nr:beta-aspartyl-peptidase [Peptoniphilus porci]OLR65598.1 beta-aspartyl-peptidase [Peptoniphilus porci]